MASFPQYLSTHVGRAQLSPLEARVTIDFSMTTGCDSFVPECLQCEANPLKKVQGVEADHPPHHLKGFLDQVIKGVRIGMKKPY